MDRRGRRKSAATSTAAAAAATTTTTTTAAATAHVPTKFPDATATTYDGGKRIDRLGRTTPS